MLDLRANVGGSPEEALALADLFLEAGPVFAERGRGGLEVRETAASRSWDGELVVLVGRGTVGEAELVARALRDADSPLVGQSTFGKRSRQETVRLRDGSVEPGDEKDPQLERALELLLGETAERKAA